MADAAGLFDAAPASAPPGAAPVSGRRTQLYGYDSAAAQLLDPYGPSVVTDMELPKLWAAAAAGSRKAAFHTELAAGTETGGPLRVGIGLSRVAQTLLAAAEQLEDETLGQLLQPGPLAAAKAELKQLRPHLQVLNAGASTGGSGGASFASARKRQRTAAAPAVPRDEATIRAAAAAFHAWLMLERSPFRAIMAVLAGKGVFFVGHVAEKTARGWARHKPATVEEAAEAALTRPASSETPELRVFCLIAR